MTGAGRSDTADANRVLPDGFRFGVTTAGYQVEGNFNGPGEPRNNWYGWEHAGRVEPSGVALDFWNRYEDALDRAVAAGCDGFRLSLEWARCEPTEGGWDSTAFDRYGAILDACRDRGLEPLVTLHHFTHPWWLGEDFWLRLDAPERYAVWVSAVVGHLGPKVRNWVTINEINGLAVRAYLTGRFPPGERLRVDRLVRTIDHLLAAHVLGYAEIHRGHPDAMVATNPSTIPVYELGPLLGDLLLARLHGISRGELTGWLRERRAAYHDSVPRGVGCAAAARAWARRSIPLERAFPRAVAAVYDSPYECTLDVTQIDACAPSPSTRWWSDRPDPGAFRASVERSVAPGRDLWVVGNGLDSRVRNGRPLPRQDGWTRPRYLREHLRSVVEVLDAGLPIAGYYHRSLADGYEWGSYERRSGIFGVDRARGCRWSDTDAMGQNSAGTYRGIIAGLRAGDRSVLRP